jgi:hypothetical protein
MEFLPLEVVILVLCGSRNVYEIFSQLGQIVRHSCFPSGQFVSPSLGLEFSSTFPTFRKKLEDQNYPKNRPGSLFT